MLLAQKLKIRYKEPEDKIKPNLDNSMPISEIEPNLDSRFSRRVVTCFFVLVLSTIFVSISKYDKLDIKILPDGDILRWGFEIGDVSRKDSYLRVFLTFSDSKMRLRNDLHAVCTLKKYYGSLETESTYNYTTDTVTFDKEILFLRSNVLTFDKLKVNCSMDKDLFHGDARIVGRRQTAIPLLPFLRIIPLLFIFLNSSISCYSMIKELKGCTREQIVVFILTLSSAIVIGTQLITLFFPSVFLLIMLRVFQHIYSGVLCLTLLNFVTLSKMWHADFIESDYFQSWLFFVLTTFFDFIRQITIYTSEISLGENYAVSNISIVSAFIVLILVIVQFYSEYSRPASFPPEFGYRRERLFQIISILLISYFVYYVFVFFNMTNIIGDDMFYASFIFLSSTLFSGASFCRWIFLACDVIVKRKQF